MKINEDLLNSIIKNKQHDLSYEDVIEIIKDLSDRGYPSYKKAKQIAIAALEELNLYEQGGLCLIPSDVYEKQCEELDRLKEKDTSKKIRMLFDNEMKTNWCLCPNCNNSFGWEHTVISKYCSKCGHKIEK